MFLPQLTPDDLRQGDVLAPIVFPRWHLPNYQLSGKVDKDARANAALTDVMMLDHVSPEGAGLNVLRKAVPLRSLICSHDCEFDKVEIKNRNGILVAPLMPPPDTSDGDAIEKLRQASSPIPTATGTSSICFPSRCRVKVSLSQTSPR